MRLLEEITGRKDQQLLKMQERLEDALNMLQLGQETYAKQQVLMDDGKKTVARLQSQLQGADSVAAACNANAAEAAAGATAARAARAAAAKATSPSAAARAKAPSPREAAQAISPTGSGAGRAAARLPPGILAAMMAGQGAGASQMSPAAAAAAARAAMASAGAEEDEQEEEIGEDELEAQQALLAKLRGLEAEKAQFEAQLRGEQGSIFAELQELQSMMSELGINLDEVTAAEA